MIVGDTGRIVAPKSPGSLADAVVELLRLPIEARAALSVAARQRIADHFEIGDVAARYLALYRDTLVAKEAA